MSRAASMRTVDTQTPAPRTLTGSRLLKPEDVAEILGLSVSTVSGMLRRGELPGIVVRAGAGKKRLRHIFRVRSTDLDSWVKARQTGPRGVKP